MRVMKTGWDQMLRRNEMTRDDRVESSDEADETNPEEKLSSDFDRDQPKTLTYNTDYTDLC